MRRVLMDVIAAVVVLALLYAAVLVTHDVPGSLPQAPY